MNVDGFNQSRETLLAELRDCKQTLNVILMPDMNKDVKLTFFDDDLFMWAIAHKCGSLIDAMIYSCNDENLDTAYILLRTIIDCCIRTYAAYLGGNDLCKRVISDGEPFNKISFDSVTLTNQFDKGKLPSLKGRMTDSNLLKIYEEYCPGITDSYHEACQFVHFSKDELVSMGFSDQENISSFMLSITGPLLEEKRDELLFVTKDFCKYCHNLLGLLKGYWDNRFAEGNTI